MDFLAGMEFGTILEEDGSQWLGLKQFRGLFESDVYWLAVRIGDQSPATPKVLVNPKVVRVSEERDGKA